jgi:hypothetical protein
MQISDRSIVAAAIWAGFDVTVELMGLVCKNERKGGVAAIVAKLEMASKRVQLGRTVDFETTAVRGEVLGVVGCLDGKGYPLRIPNADDHFGIHWNTEHVVPHIGVMERLI